VRGRWGFIGFAVLVIAVVIAPQVSTHYRTYPARVRRIYLIALLGLNILTGFTGQISLGHGAFMGIGAYVTTILLVDHGWNDLLTLPVAGVVAGLAGLAFGLPATRFAGPYLALATFADPALVHRPAQAVPALHRRDARQAAAAVHSQFGIHANSSVWIYWVSWIVALFMLVVAWLIVRGRFGRALQRSVRDSEIASTASGVSTAGVKTVALRDLGVLLRSRRPGSSRSP